MGTSGPAEALLHGAAVPPRASAEGPLPSVLPDRRRDHRTSGCGERVTGALCRGARDARDLARSRRNQGMDARAELRWMFAVPPEVLRGAEASAGKRRTDDVLGLPATGNDESTACFRLQ